MTLAIAPDLRCTTHSGKVFWIEIKDKSQRFYYPDTGGDLHQALGWYNINKHLNEPVFMLFKDPELEKCFAKRATEKDKEIFTERWEKFAGESFGNWLSNCLVYSKENRYPIVSYDSSRNKEMFIMYFHTDTMRRISSFASIVKEAEEAHDVPELQVFGLLGYEALLVRSATSKRYVEFTKYIFATIKEHISRFMSGTA
jgi:hypothetical protein